MIPAHWPSFIDGMIAGAALMAVLLLAIEIVASYQSRKRAKRFTDERS